MHGRLEKEKGGRNEHFLALTTKIMIFPGEETIFNQLSTDAGKLETKYFSLQQILQTFFAHFVYRSQQSSNEPLNEGVPSQFMGKNLFCAHSLCL